MWQGTAPGMKDLCKGTGLGPSQDAELMDPQERQQEGVRPHAAPARSTTCQATVPGTQERLLVALALKGGCHSERQGGAGRRMRNPDGPSTGFLIGLIPTLASFCLTPR